MVGTISCFCLDDVTKVMMLGVEAMAIEAVGRGRMDDVVACNRSVGSDVDIQPPQSMNSYREVRYKERGHTPTLRS